MQREEVNIYINGLLSLSDSSEGRRDELVELAFFHDTWPGFLAEWLWTNQKGIESALFIKTWLGWSYEETGKVFGVDFREVSQILRTQRVAYLGNYPPPTDEEKEAFGGISCFMVEQQLSGWLDAEWEETSGLSKIYAHLKACEDCKNRMDSYRRLQSELLSMRGSFPIISEEEWDRARTRITQKKRRTRLQWVFIIFLSMVFIGIILWMLQSQPEKMPNIYEIKET